MWAPTRNLLLFTTIASREDEETKSINPQIGFMQIPSRQEIKKVSLANSQDVRMFIHPAGKYHAVMNQYMPKKTRLTAIELFDLSDNRVMHETLKINREVHEFHNIAWEPNHTRFAVHTKSKRELAEGKKDYSTASVREGIDIYECTHDEDLGFKVKSIGAHPSEKVIDCVWSPAGEIFAICEKDGPSINAKHIWSCFMIVMRTEQEKKKGTQ